MSTNCAAIAGVADHLLSSNSGEEFLRSAASRHFYAALHHCTAWKATLPGMPSIGGPEGGMHQDLINELSRPDRQCSNEQKMQSKKFAYILQTMRRLRVTADYKLDATVTKQEAEAQRAQALNILSVGI